MHLRVCHFWVGSFPLAHRHKLHLTRFADNLHSGPSRRFSRSPNSNKKKTNTAMGCGISPDPVRELGWAICQPEAATRSSPDTQYLARGPKIRKPPQRFAGYHRNCCQKVVSGSREPRKRSGRRCGCAALGAVVKTALTRGRCHRYIAWGLLRRGQSGRILCECDSEVSRVI